MCQFTFALYYACGGGVCVCVCVCVCGCVWVCVGVGGWVSVFDNLGKILCRFLRIVRRSGVAFLKKKTPILQQIYRGRAALARIGVAF